ncbi:hypothetical protein STCU_11617 [Strigomonas culicis]|uniref:Right handed beta helix domain-containing protein n=1 Tax=Strigomonas culicis TaxID=28005 RepID=S9TDB1_9TRYP|nr:hypothetical protein STCU_11617 [Strigomonas culicis]|eukprot:EPY16002.1 hypothetical protein STCU_11617 [Strigomonas culicis]
MVRGDSSGAISAIGGSLLVRDSTTTQLTNVAFHNMGKRGSRKGYAVWLDGISNSKAKVVMENCTMFASFHRGVVLSDTRHVTLKGLMLQSFDGFGIAAVGTYHTSLVVRDCVVSGARANRGSLDTTAAGAFFTYPTLSFVSNEVSHSDGYGVWIALRSSFATTTQRTCPAIASLALFLNNTVHVTRYQGIIVYPVHMAAVSSCASNVFSDAGMTDLVRTSAGMLVNNTVFMCGTYGVHLPVMSGYNVSGLAVADCAEGALSTSYPTSYVGIQDAVFWGTMPTGEETLFFDALGGLGAETDPDYVTDSTSRAGHTDGSCGGASNSSCPSMRVGVHALHGGYVLMDRVMFGNFYNGTAMWLSTRVGQPSFSPAYDALVSAEEREVNGQQNGQLVVTALSLGLRGSRRWDAVLSGYTSLHDCDGVIAGGPSRDTYILANRAVLQEASFCDQLNATSRTNVLAFTSDLSIEATADGSVQTSLRPSSFKDWMSSMDAAALETAAATADLTVCYVPDMSTYSTAVSQVVSDVGADEDEDLDNVTNSTSAREASS